MEAQVSPRLPPGEKAAARRGPRGRTNPFVAKRAQRRRASLARSLTRVRVPLSSQWRAHRPLHRMPSWLKGVIGGLVLLLSVGLHVAFVVMALGISRLGKGPARPREQVAIEVREARREEKKPEPPKPEPEPPKPERVLAVRTPPKAETPEPKGPPPRVVGLSFESTVGEGESGEGPAFAVGNTRLGETEKVAAKPKDVPKETVNRGPTTVTPNKAATRVPMAGVTFTQPKRKKEVKPEYPPTLKAQSVEADVVVVVTVNVEGKVTRVIILREAPYPEFNDAAKQAAMQDEFEPATRNGEPFESTLKYTIRFRLEDQ